jgi:uncharacterized LabA/DUF88 family protein
MKRSNFYIDGFNLYFGMIQAGYTDCKWLNIWKLADRIINKNQVLGSVKFFTSRINNNKKKQGRQYDFLNALFTTDTEIIYGHFLSQPFNCRICGARDFETKEKMTDVNIATQILKDAFTNSFDVAFLISGDSDLVPPLRMIRDLFPDKELIVVFPPERKSTSLSNVAHRSFTLSRGKLKSSQFPDQVVNKHGHIIQKPAEWL